jgi:hypothetical protein
MGTGSGGVGSTNNAGPGIPNAGIKSPNTMNDQLGQSPDRTNPTANNPAVNPTMNTR